MTENIEKDSVIADRDRPFRTDHLTVGLGGRTARGATVMVGSQGIKFLIITASAIVLSRLLTPQDYGLLAMVAVVTNFSYPLRNLGLSNATIQKPDLSYEQVSTLFWVNVCLSVIITFLTILLAPGVARFYGEPRLTWITIGIAGSFIFSGLSMQHEALLKRQMRFLGLAVSDIASMLLGSTIAIFLAWRGFGYWALVTSQLVIGATYALGVWISCNWWPGLPAPNSGVRSMLRFGTNLTGNNIVNYLARNIDNLLIGRFWGANQLGLYSRAYQLLLLPLDQLSAPLDGVAVTALSRLADSPARYCQAYLRMLEKVAMATMPIMVFMIMTSDWLVRVALGPQWHDTARIFALLGLVGLVEPVSSTVGWLLISQARSRDLLQLGLLDAALSIVCIVIGLPWGAIGVAASYGIAGLCIRKPIRFWFATRVGPVAPSDFYRAILPSLFASGSVAVVLLSLRTWTKVSNPMYGLLMSLITAILVALLSLLLLPRGRRALQDVRSLLPVLLKTKPQYGRNVTS